MGNSSSTLDKEEIEEIRKETGFSKRLILQLYSRFSSLDKSNDETLGREDLMSIPELAINPLGDRIVNAFFCETTNEDRINFRQFVKVAARFRPISRRKPGPNSRKDKLLFAFSIYDMDSDRCVTKEELKTVLNMMVGASITSEQLQAIAEKAIQEADFIQDGIMSFDEYCRMMEKIDIEKKMSIRSLR